MLAACVLLLTTHPLQKPAWASSLCHMHSQQCGDRNIQHQTPQASCARLHPKYGLEGVGIGHASSCRPCGVEGQHLRICQEANPLAGWWVPSHKSGLASFFLFMLVPADSVSLQMHKPQLQTAVQTARLSPSPSRAHQEATSPASVVLLHVGSTPWVQFCAATGAPQESGAHPRHQAQGGGVFCLLSCC